MGKVFWLKQRKMEMIKVTFEQHSRTSRVRRLIRMISLALAPQRVCLVIFYIYFFVKFKLFSFF